MQEAIIEFKDFSFKYNALAQPTLNNINLKIYPKEKVLIVGTSGCGKSTLVNCINGLIPFTYKGEISGTLTIKGKKTIDQSIVELSSSIGTVLQDTDCQFISMTVLEDIAFALENQCVKQKEMIDRVNRVSQIVSMNDYLHHAPSELSGGQKQRVAIAGVMVDDVDVMLFDEPLANLDPATGKTAIKLIDDIQKKTEATVIIVEHRLEDVLYKSVDRIVLMDEGRIVFDGNSDDLLSLNLLSKHGIREPLYLSALKYANVEINKEKKPSHLDTLELTVSDKQKVKNWFNKIVFEKNKSSTESILTIKNLSFSYNKKKKVLNDISLDIKKGELVALVGKNGAGKTTLAKILCGFEKQSSGQLYYKSESMDDLSIKERADKIGYVMQNPNKMISKVMIFDEVALGLQTRGYSPEEIKVKVEEVLKVCGLYQYRNWPISALSYGQRKRVTIASILVLDPEVLILDEPTAGQDFKHYSDIMEFLLSLHNRGLTIIMITHDMHLMLEYGQRCIVLCDGNIIADDTSANVLSNDEITEKAALKRTSLYDFAELCDLKDGQNFVDYFIQYDRKVRYDG